MVATIEARMTSSRLPGKVVAECMGVTMLERLITRLKSVATLDGIVLATTINSQDEILVEIAEKMGIEVFCGSENNVFERVIQAATFMGADTVVEITADCPLIDPVLIEQMTQIFRANEIDYLSNCEFPSYPLGMEIQVVSLSALKKSYGMTDSPLDQEHVTLHLRRNSTEFRKMHVIAPLGLRFPNFSVTLDELSDLEVIKFVVENLEPTNHLFGCQEIISLLKQNPDVAMLNSGVIRKGDT